MTNPDSEILPGYQMLRTLGRGNTSQVRLALNPEGQEVAVKLPHPETLRVHEAAERFGNEVRLTMQFKHPHVVRGFAGTAFGPQAYLSLEYYPDGALSEKLARMTGRTLPDTEALRILADIASALTYLHKLGAVHQDVKTQNIYVNEAGRAALGDLGNTYFLSQGGKVSGSPYYMAPEIYHGESSSSASDVYSLGITMYQLLTGQRPFTGNTYEELMIAHLTRFATPLSHLKPQLARPVGRLAEQALAKRPTDRPSADTIRRALLTALGETPHDEVTEDEQPAAPQQQMGRHGPVARQGPAAAPSKPDRDTDKAEQPQKRGWNPFKRK